jgi:hypothetical protein
MSGGRPPRSRILYQAALIPPPIALVWMIATGRLREYFGVFNLDSLPSPEHIDRSFGTAMIWTAAVGPVLFLAWERGREHVAARRTGMFLWTGLAEVVRRAFGREPSFEALAAQQRPPRDRPGVALAWGLTTAMLVPSFFLSVAPFLRSAWAVLWLVVAGALMGTSVYLNRRAVAYLLAEPSLWSPFRGLSMLNPERFAPEGRVFVRLQPVTTIALMLWWLVGGSYLVFR